MPCAKYLTFFVFFAYFSKILIKRFPIIFLFFSGSETFLHLHNQDIKCVATIEEVKSYEVDENVKINFDLSKIYLFKESGELLYSPYQK